MAEHESKADNRKDADDSRVDAIAAVAVLIIVVSAFVYILSTI